MTANSQVWLIVPEGRLCLFLFVLHVMLAGTFTGLMCSILDSGFVILRLSVPAYTNMFIMSCTCVRLHVPARSCPRVCLHTPACIYVRLPSREYAYTRGAHNIPSIGAHRTPAARLAIAAQRRTQHQATLMSIQRTSHQLTADSSSLDHAIPFHVPLKPPKKCEIA